VPLIAQTMVERLLSGASLQETEALAKKHLNMV
jgi:hypothetical protein